MSGTGTSSSSPCEPRPRWRSPTPSGPCRFCQQAAERLCTEGGGHLRAPVKAQDPSGDPHRFCGSCGIRHWCHGFAGLMAHDAWRQVSHQKTQLPAHSGGTTGPRGSEKTKDRECPAKRAGSTRKHQGHPFPSLGKPAAKLPTRPHGIRVSERSSEGWPNPHTFVKDHGFRGLRGSPPNTQQQSPSMGLTSRITDPAQSWQHLSSEDGNIGPLYRWGK